MAHNMFQRHDVCQAWTAARREQLVRRRGCGEDTPDSDYDILVVVEDAERPIRNIEAEALGRLAGLRVPVDVLVWTRREFDRRIPVVASLPAAVMREGKLLHAA